MYLWSLTSMYLVNVHSCYPGNPFLLWLAFFAEILRHDLAHIGHFQNFPQLWCEGNPVITRSNSNDCRPFTNTLLYCMCTYKATAMTSFSLHFRMANLNNHSLCRAHFAFLYKLMWRQKKVSEDTSIHTEILEEQALWLEQGSHLYRRPGAAHLAMRK